MDYATKWAEVFPLAETKAHIIIARHFVDETVFRYSAPKHLLSDMGTQMVAQVVNEASQLVGTQRLVTTPYRPTTDGTVERFNYSLAKQLSIAMLILLEEIGTHIRNQCHMRIM